VGVPSAEVLVSECGEMWWGQGAAAVAESTLCHAWATWQRAAAPARAG